MIRRAPAGYVVHEVGGARLVAHQGLAPALQAALEGQRSLYDWAAAHPARRELQGRRPVYSAPLSDDGPRVVVRRSRHGGLLAPLLGDFFLTPTRAPGELRISLVLAQAGVPTPPVAGYVLYRAGPLLRRVDMVTIELPGHDLGQALREATSAERRLPLARAVAVALGALTQAGAWHPDLNVKNILLVPDDAGELHPAVLDVDRVSFVPPGDPNLREANFQRMARSVAKWRALHGAGFTDDELEDIRQLLLRDEAIQAAHRAIAMEEYMP
ncbi:MAG: lipopolysaccharide kinase InaA family protein [Gemmatimonadaceae bacterium]